MAKKLTFWRLLKVGWRFYREKGKLMNKGYDWKKGVWKATKAVLIVGVSALLAALTSEQAWSAFSDVPAIGAVLVLIGPAVATWLLNLIKHAGD